MNLSSSRLDVGTARKLVNCLNGNESGPGALGELAQLVQAMTNEELKPFVDGVNRSFLGSAKNLYESGRILDDLRARGELDSALAGVGTLLEQDALIAHSISLFRRSFVLSDNQVDPRLLSVLERLAREMTEEHVQDALDLGLVAADARAFASLWDHLSPGSTTPSTLSPAAAEGLVAYANSKSTLGRELINHLLHGRMFEFVDKIVPDDAAGLAGHVPQWGAILDPLTADQGRIAAGVGSLFEAVSGPIPCLQGARSLRYPPMEILSELIALPNSQVRAFISRDKMAQLYSVFPLCEFPSAAGPGYGELVRLANTPGIEPLTDIIREAFKIQNRDGSRPIAEFIVRALAAPEFKGLLPALGELESRSAWQDLLLLATAPRLRDRTQLTELLKILIEPISTPAGVTSIYDVLTEGIAKSNPEELTAWLQSFKSTGDGLASGLRGLRAAYYVNDVHPLFALFRGVIAEAPRDQVLIQALLKISERPEFQGSVRELSRMAKDGRLKDILATMLSLLKRYVETGQSDVHSLPPGVAGPILRFTARHELASADLTPWLDLPGTVDFGSCAHVDLSIRWDQVQSPTFEEQLEAVSNCIGNDGLYSALGESFKLLSREKTDDATARSLHVLVIEAYNTLQFTRAEAAMISDSLLAAVTDGRVMRTLKALPILVKEAVLRPLVDLVAPWIQDAQARLSMRRLGLFGASVLKRDDLPQTLAYIDDLFRAHPTAPAPLARAAYDRERILRWISNKECTSVTHEGQKQQRLAEILDEYENAIVNDGVREKGKLREAWTLPELQQALEPIFKKFSDIPGNGPVLRGLLAFAARFNDPKQYPPGYLESWLRKLANDRRAISYFYPGEKVPRVRLVNGLDRLALVLINADIFIKEADTNPGFQFLGDLADSWGDVPFAQRPAPIQIKFKEGQPCPTLGETSASIRDTATMLYSTMLGLPEFPKCTQTADPTDKPDDQLAETTDPTVVPEAHAPADPAIDPELAVVQFNMYNIAQTMSVLKETAEDGGLRVLRDLFYELLYTGPIANQDPGAGLKNNLSVVTYLVKSGLLREVGRLIADTPADDPVIHSFFATLTEGAASPETGPLAEALFADPSHELIWNVIEEVLKLKSPKDVATAKTIGLHGLAALDSLGRARNGADKPNELLKPALQSIAATLAHDSKLLARHTDLIADFLTWKDGADFLQLLYTDRASHRLALASLVKDAVADPQRGPDLLTMLGALDASPTSHQAWKRFRARWKALDALAEYRSLRLDEVGRQLLNFFEGRTDSGQPLSPEKATLARKLLKTIAALLERGDFELVDQLMALAQRKPNEFYKLIEAASALIDGGEIPRLLELVQSKLGPAA